MFFRTKKFYFPKHEKFFQTMFLIYFELGKLPNFLFLRLKKFRFLGLFPGGNFFKKNNNKSIRKASFEKV